MGRNINAMTHAKPTTTPISARPGNPVVGLSTDIQPDGGRGQQQHQQDAGGRGGALHRHDARAATN